MGGFGHEEGEHVAIGDARIRVGWRGNPDGPVLLLLHGGFGSSADFDPLIDALSPHLRLVGIDSRGHGASTSGSAPLTYARLAEDVEAVSAALGIGRCHVLGYSDGGIVGLRLAAAGWPRLLSLVTIGASWRLLRDDPVEGFLAALTPEGWRDIDPAGYERYHRVNPEPDFPALIEAIRGLWLDAAAMGYPGETIRRITAPVLFIRGDDDQFISRAEQAELADRVPGARLLNLPFAGHDAQVGEPEAVAAAVLRLLGTA
jgi:valacyclovir hydrolase